MNMYQGIAASRFRDPPPIFECLSVRIASRRRSDKSATSSADAVSVGSGAAAPGQGRPRRQAVFHCGRRGSLDQVDDQPGDEQGGDDNPAHGFAVQWVRIAETKQRTAEPDQHRQDRARQENCGTSENRKMRRCHTVHVAPHIASEARTSTISVRRFCCRPSAVAFDAERVGRPLPCARRRLGSFTWRRQRCDGVGARLRQLEIGREARLSDRLVIGEAVDQDVARLVVQRIADATEQRQIRCGQASASPEPNMLRLVRRTVTDCASCSTCTSPALISGARNSRSFANVSVAAGGADGAGGSTGATTGVGGIGLARHRDLAPRRQREQLGKGDIRDVGQQQGEGDEDRGGEFQRGQGRSPTAAPAAPAPGLPAATPRHCGDSSRSNSPRRWRIVRYTPSRKFGQSGNRRAA